MLDFSGVPDDWRAVFDVWKYRDGALFWRIAAGRGVSVKRPGDLVATVPDGLGYCYVTYKRKHYAVHRVVFALTRGWLPECIDHIDGNPGNNREENLRPATRLQNQHNRRRNKRSKSGVKNVHLHRGRWHIRFSINGKTKHYGGHDTLEKATVEAARIRLALHRGFARHA